MPVIVLGNRSGSLPIDPTFDDGGVIQVLDPSVEFVLAFRIIEQLITISGGEVTTNSIAGSSTFTDSTEEVNSQSIVSYFSFSAHVVPTSTTTVTPNISASTTPTPSAPDGGPTVSDFTDESIYVSGGSVIFSSGFSVEVVPEQDVSVIATTTAGSSTFTQGDVASGISQPPEQDGFVLHDDGMSAPVITTSKTTVLS